MVKSVKPCLPTHAYVLLECMLISLFNSPTDLFWSVYMLFLESSCLQMITGTWIRDDYELGGLENGIS